MKSLLLIKIPSILEFLQKISIAYLSNQVFNTAEFFSLGKVKFYNRVYKLKYYCVDDWILNLFWWGFSIKCLENIVYYELKNVELYIYSSKYLLNY